MSRAELADFLRTRRARRTPADASLPSVTHRRTPGLRRDEVAELAHMSVDYYTRLEQARGPRPSPRILDALAEALGLTSAERMHLFRLAGAHAMPPRHPARVVRPHVATMLNRIPGTATVVTDASYDVLAWNPLAEALLGELHREPNLARRHFLGLAPAMHPETQPFGPIAAARLRASHARYPQDERLARLVAELRSESREFRELWQRHPAPAPGHRRKSMLHPDVGALQLNCDVLPVHEEDQEIVFVTADPDSATADALAHLERRPSPDTPPGRWPPRPKTQP